MATVSISKTLQIGDKTYHYDDCNVYQACIYRMVDKQVKFIKEKENKAKFDNTQSNYNDVQRAIGVLEYLLGKMEAYAGIKEIPHMFTD
jgi:hypothetical protein